ncbi:cation transporter [Desulfuribacillus stibiiarsenatis]|uniref:Cation transporter n=1 Tax=Desulfuribacillus stibiiarsenatis TaxID=1390249 RepID=A0A1E5L816_9FIRM|nr:sodium:calcium antiporter [Desulfuribacillus stibiiarsenatis]OEH86290.1 cation transporter [Desulfuribacillus stibiiarsenatis]
MVFVYFLIASIVTVYSAMKLSNYADVLSEKTSFGGLLIGTVLLAAATSLPEVTTTISAIVIDNPDIAIANVLGSNIFNVLVIAVFDILFRRKRLFLLASYTHRITATLGIVLTIIVMVAMLLDTTYQLIGIGLSSILLVIVYGLGMWVISKINIQVKSHILQEEIQAESKITEPKVADISVRQAVIGFAVFSLVILVSGSALAILGDKIAIITGLGSTFVGSFLIAATTSLPEVVSVYAALKLSNVNLALGAVLGSNIFNMLIIAFADLVYRHGSILGAIDPIQFVTAFGGAVMALLLLVTLFYRKAKNLWVYSIPPTIIVITYFIVTFIIFTQ